MTKLNFRDWLEVNYSDIGHARYNQRLADDEEYLWAWIKGELLVRPAEFGRAHGSIGIQGDLAKGRVNLTEREGSISFLVGSPNQKQKEMIIDQLLKRFPDVRDWYVWDDFIDGMPLDQWWRQAA